ncbi:hypothetical protein SLEP1_g28337 [Rubroshorea leprosula]|uniref:Uncharacterized protein n=1 Tax=Rubroshorea leprosula TaxID=152421 RepID=A0AAV5K215_9ROSI|nr:hypothetical protein SLEP1_g28337 [Rubroshorea leprosula]
MFLYKLRVFISSLSLDSSAGKLRLCSETIFFLFLSFPLIVGFTFAPAEDGSMFPVFCLI